MPTRKIADHTTPRICRHPDHAPAAHIVRRPGRYEHVCPACGHRVFRVNAPSWLAQR